MTTPEGTDQRLAYRSVPESYGGTFNFHQGLNTKIGTSRLISCVGVYLPIDAHRCFFAHIFGWHQPADPPYHMENYVRDFTRQKDEGLRRQVYEKLRNHSHQEGWTAQDVQNCVRESGRKIVVMCPRKTDVMGRPGVPVVKAIEDFVGGREGWDRYFDDDKLQGFVVDHANGEVTKMGSRSDNLGDVVLHPDFKPEEELAAKKEWKIRADSQ